jgi:hypothetical protein
VPLSHIFLHVALCNAVARAAPETQIDMRVRMSYRVGGDEIDKTVRFARGTAEQTVVEFDIRRSMYRLQLDVPKFACGASDFVDVLADANRTVSETLGDGAPAAPAPVVIFDGTAPISFVYLKPTFAVFDASTVCGKPITAPLPAKFEVEYDQGGYYVKLHADPSFAGRGPLVVALKLRTTTGLAHYVHLPVPFPQTWGGWPGSVQFDITEDMVDDLATEKTDTLLCPKMWGTNAG